MLKRISIIILIFILSFTFGCAPRLDGIETQLKELNAQYEELLEKFNESKEQNADLSEELLSLQKQLDLLNAKVDNLNAAEPVFDALEPAILPREDDIVLNSLNRNSTEIDETSLFDVFSDYCKTALSGYCYCLLEPIESEADFHPLMTREYSLFAESEENGKPINPMIFERLKMYSEVLDIKYNMRGEGLATNLTIGIYSIPLETKQNPENFYFEFGIIDKESVNNDKAYENIKVFDRYINIYYLGENGKPRYFATCYYYSFVNHISEKWFDSYFAEYFHCFF